MLLRFLTGGLIDVGGDDAKLEKLTATSNDLTAVLKKAPAKAASFALVAFDPETPAVDPVIQGAVEALRKRWPTYVNTFAGTPVAVIRAMLLDALIQAARDDEKVAVAFVTSARNVLPFTEAGGERRIWADVVQELEVQIDTRAEAEWATPSSIILQGLDFPTPPTVDVRASSKRANKDTLLTKVEAASGPQSKSGTATGGNPYWPNSAQAWVQEFAPRLAEAIGETVDSVAASVSVAPIDFAAPLQQLSTAVSTHVQEALNAFAGATTGLQRRTNLLWWKEALFSPSARLSYRELPASMAVALMAFDLHQQIPIFSPASVTAFLRETASILPSVDDQQERPLRSLLEEARNADSLSKLRESATELFAPPTGRGPLLALIGHPETRPTLDDQTFRDLVGVPAATALTLPSWAVWIFREFQAARATSEGSGPKRRPRKG
jgi:hypothetical protein